jgi:hypothetical protein
MYPEPSTRNTWSPFLRGREDAFGGTDAGVAALALDLAGAGMVSNVGPDAALINPPENAATENTHSPAPLASADGVCYAGAFGPDRTRFVTFMTDFPCALP